MKHGEIVVYKTAQDAGLKLEVRVEDETVWLTQQQIADLFGTQRPAITKHLKNIYQSGELDENSTCSILEHMGSGGIQKYKTRYYSLDAILSVGYVQVEFKNTKHVITALTLFCLSDTGSIPKMQLYSAFGQIKS